MTDQPSRQLSGDEIAALKFAAHRQLARWANKPQLSPHQRARRNALKRAVRILQDHAFASGCAMRAPDEEEHTDG
jgi:hypothetical protein